MSSGLKFVCVFPFDDEMEMCSIIRKSYGPIPGNPNGQAGLLNGWGGKIEAKDLGRPDNAVRREFKEESGIPIPNIQLFHFATEHYAHGNTVYFYYFRDTQIAHALIPLGKNKDGDDIIPLRPFERSINELEREKFVWNTPYLLHMAKVLSQRPFDTWPAA